jgi:hypothetical protein
MERINDIASTEAEARELWRQVYAAKLSGVGYSVTFAPEQHQMAKDNADIAYNNYLLAFGHSKAAAAKTGT